MVINFHKFLHLRENKAEFQNIFDQAIKPNGFDWEAMQVAADYAEENGMMRDFQNLFGSKVGYKLSYRIWEAREYWMNVPYTREVVNNPEFSILRKQFEDMTRSPNSLMGHIWDKSYSITGKDIPPYIHYVKKCYKELYDVIAKMCQLADHKPQPQLKSILSL